MANGVTWMHMACTRGVPSEPIHVQSYPVKRIADSGVQDVWERTKKPAFTWRFFWCQSGHGYWLRLPQNRTNQG